jgi:methylmalonyl-CoA/ethylmalonyl-CoA epimerase
VQYPLDHVAVAVEDLEAAVPLYTALTGGAATPRERLPSQGVDVVFVGEGAGRIELIAPVGDDSPVARFLARRGPGLHHLAYRVPDLTATLAELRARGVPLIDETPRLGAHDRLVAFVHPRASGGVLIELVQE